MSLRFVFEPPPRIKLIRHQTINFFVGEPHIRFYKVKRSSAVKSESSSLLYEREREKDRDRERSKERSRDRDKERDRDRDKERDRDRDKERDISRESRSLDSEKKKAQRQKPTSYVDKSFNGCNELLQSIRSKKKLKNLFDLIGPEPSLTQIETNLLNCSYNSIDEFFRDLLDFFVCAVESYIRDPETEKSAQHFIQTIEQTQKKMITKRSTVSFSELNHQFQKFVDVKVPLPKQSDSSSTSSSTSSRNLEKIAQDLNKLDSKKKLKAEWIIRIQCPSLPYYSSGIDLLLLPDSAIDSLVELINSE
ncbi:hypothetical protein M9Y10_039471 [Tritrichomonas musculus]|uniref:Uncharacterized protein n=1 Tax=Tritrichomonas musculus TaxID=1915356 RepID=A0ABR2KBB4_9EUKA